MESINDLFLDDHFRPSILEEIFELYTRFFHSLDTEINPDCSKELAVDLYRAILIYRLYAGSIEKLLIANPQIALHISEISTLWRELDLLNPEDLANISIRLLEDL